MRSARWALLAFVFVVDVHVRADQILAADDRRVVTTFAHAHLTLKPGSLATAADGRLRLVRGSLYVEGPLKLTTPFAELACDGAACAALITRNGDDGVSLDALSSGWRVAPRGAAAPLAVSDATRVRVGAVGSDGRAALEPPQALEWAPLVRAWGKLFAGEAESFVAKVREFRPRWSEAVEALSEDQRGRALAALDDQRRAADARARAARAAAAEDGELRRLFRRKNFVED